MLATQLPAVVACRCSPTQKADVARLIRSFTKKTVCCIGDGGNDVAMIQAADVGEFPCRFSRSSKPPPCSSSAEVQCTLELRRGGNVGADTLPPAGIGIVGKEGKQASLAADFSINQFSYLSKLLLWHGRNSYKRSAKLSQFVIHRGLIIAVIQAVFSSIFFFAREFALSSSFFVPFMRLRAAKHLADQRGKIAGGKMEDGKWNEEVERS